MEPESPVPDLELGQLLISHLTDWIFIAILLVLWGVCQIVTPFQRYVGASNFVTQSIMYPYKSNTIPFQAVPV
jgi:diacylglycerol diphosphate phosphatase/phosphatidate phosphatase